jgi:penicillin-binding protein 1A
MVRLLKTLVAMLVVAVLTPIASAGVMLAAFLFLPLPAQLPPRQPPNESQISRVYDADGNQIATFKQFETSIPVEPEDIPPILKAAVIAAEDKDFYTHGGVDLRGTVRALWADLRSGEAVQGGSTITQQLVKNTVTGGERSLSRKVREAILASQLDRQVEKEEILFEYLSVIYLGEGAYGVGAAAETYFDKPVSELTVSESALLAAVIPAPSRYSPRVDPGLAEQRRKLVLKAMLDERMIEQSIYDSALLEPVWLESNGPPPGYATLVKPRETQTSSQPFFTDYVFQYLKSHLEGGEAKIYQGGLKIETTLDPTLQFIAATEVGEFLDGLPADLEMSIVSVEPPTGFVRSFVGGRDYNVSKVNLALGRAGGGSGRQPGSSFKPFILAEAFEQGILPSKTYSGAPHAVGTDTVIENYGGARYGTLDLRTATRKSVNTVFTRLILDVGVDKAMDRARLMGVSSVPPYDGAKYGASVALGALDVAPIEMASAYGVFANSGVLQDPTPVLRVTDRDGKVLIDNTDRNGKRVLKEEVADNVTDILRGVLVDGTAAGRGIDRPAAGKTGTTTNNVDSWFIGFTPTLSTSVWLGYRNDLPGQEEPKSLTNIKGVRAVTGGTHPARIWQSYMKAALKDVPITEFSEPAPIRGIADQAKKRARQGFEPGPRQRPTGPGGDYFVDAPMPQADAPTTTSTTTPDDSTTSTTKPGGGSTTTFTIIGNTPPEEPDG